MTLNEFIFSNKHPHKLLRHLSFWSVFGIEYYLQSILPIQDNFYVAFVSLLCYFPVCILCIYSFLYFLIPLIKSRKYLQFAITLFSLCLGVAGLNFFASIVFFAVTCECPLSAIKLLPVLGQDGINTLHAITTGALVLGFKIGKEWILKQKENKALAKLKVAKDLRLEKMRIYPRFLFRTLSKLKSGMDANSSDSPNVILNLSDLLSFLLYESEENFVPLEEEIDIVRKLLYLEKINDGDLLTLTSTVSIQAGNKAIRPLTLFSVLQACFEVLSASMNENIAADLQINSDDDEVIMKLSLGRGDRERGDESFDELLKAIKGRLAELHEEDIQVSRTDNFIEVELVVILVSIGTQAKQFIYERA